MSEHGPTLDELFEATVSNAADSEFRKRARAEFDRRIAEVERAAAEKSWNRCAESAFYNPGVRGQVDHPVNPYRRKGEDK